jgi:hypothetical protein
MNSLKMKDEITEIFCTIIILMIFVNTSSRAQAEHDLYLYTSSDGTTFGAAVHLVDSADVPSLTQDSSGRLICVFQNFKGGFGSSAWDKLGVVSSTDNGSTWSAMTLLNITGLPGTTQRAFDPTIVMTADNKYRLYFSYCPDNMVLDSTCDTYSAISTDFINYTAESGVRFSELNVKVIDPAVVYFNSLWHYTTPLSTPPPAPHNGGARHATSSDGLAFTLIDSSGVGDLNYKWTGNLMDDGAVMRFYGFTDNAMGNFIWWASSTDGSNWSSYNLTNIKGKDPGIFKTSSSYFMVVPKDPATVAVKQIYNKKPKVEIFPNPVKSSATVVLLNNKELWSWSLFDASGKIVQHTEKINGTQLGINTFDLPSGVYLYLIRTADGKNFSGKLSVD